jgi:hypothetical protein
MQQCSEQHGGQQRQQQQQQAARQASRSSDNGDGAVEGGVALTPPLPPSGGWVFVVSSWRLRGVSLESSCFLPPRLGGFISGCDP